MRTIFVDLISLVRGIESTAADDCRTKVAVRIHDSSKKYDAPHYHVLFMLVKTATAYRVVFLKDSLQSIQL